MKQTLLALGIALASALPAAADMTVAFDTWGDIPRCTTGRPGTVPNPVFTIKGIPAGTDKLTFKLKDLDVPSYNHGGGTLKGSFKDATKIPAGSFKYKSPCPPSGKHTYEWTATAKQGGKTLATAKSRRAYP